MSKKQLIQRLALVVFVVAVFVSGAHADALYYDRASFESDLGVTTISRINFDNMAVGTDLTNQTILGVTFGAPGASPLEVIAASTGVRYPMSASTGLNVLSPGGSNTVLENDDLRLTFANPVRAAGLDVVFDVPDGLSYASVSFYDQYGNLLGFYGFIPSPSGAPGYQFVGYVADSAIIKSVLFDEFDGSAMDDHVAYDSVTFSPAAAAVPLPPALLLFGPGLAGLVALRKRFSK